LFTKMIQEVPWNRWRSPGYDSLRLS